MLGFLDFVLTGLLIGERRAHPTLHKQEEVGVGSGGFYLLYLHQRAVDFIDGVLEVGEVVVEGSRTVLLQLQQWGCKMSVPKLACLILSYFKVLSFFLFCSCGVKEWM